MAAFERKVLLRVSGLSGAILPFFAVPWTPTKFMSLRVRSGNVYCWISWVEIVDKLRQVHDSMVRIHAKYRLHIRNKIGLFCLLHKYPVAPVAIFIS